ncbi:MAG: hypothetical protein ACK5NN_11890 [Sphingomonadaceae bacterium]
MNFRAAFAITVSALAMLAMPAHAEIQSISEPGPNDYQQIDARVQPVFAQLRANQFQAAVDTAFAGNPLYANTRQQTGGMVEKIGNAIASYGPVHNCVASERETLGPWRVSITYVCQHDTMLSAWNFRLDRLSGGWSISNMSMNVLI